MPNCRSVCLYLASLKSTNANYELINLLTPKARGFKLLLPLPPQLRPGEKPRRILCLWLQVPNLRFWHPSCERQQYSPYIRLYLHLRHSSAKRRLLQPQRREIQRPASYPRFPSLQRQRCLHVRLYNFWRTIPLRTQRNSSKARRLRIRGQVLGIGAGAFSEWEDQSSPHRVWPGRLEGILEVLKVLQEEKVSGFKIVYRIVDWARKYGLSLPEICFPSWRYIGKYLSDVSTYILLAQWELDIIRVTLIHIRCTHYSMAPPAKRP